MPFTMDPAGWDAIVKEIVEKQCMPRAEAVAAACNENLQGSSPATGRDQHPPGYEASLQGNPSKTLREHDWHATVITATNEAAADNARNNTMVNNFYHAEDDR